MENFEDQKFISGIYNWCDRWCERCAMTDHCRLFEREESQKQANPEQDWTEALADNFAETLQMLHQIADEIGIDLESEEIKEETEAQLVLSDAHEVIAEKHPLHELSEEYFKKGKAWLESPVLKNQLLLWKNWMGMGTVEVERAESNLNLAEEALEVIQWFMLMIPVKIKRALHDQIDGFWEQYEEYERGDLGTAKVAALAIGRSVEAWEMLHKLLPEEEDLTDILSILDKLLKGLLEVFPNYSKFIRPGFDT